MAADLKTCSNCGAALNVKEGLIEGRRLITVLAAEIVGLSSLVGKINQNEISACGKFYLDELVKVVTAHSGIVYKCAGNNIIALFGIPVIYEDDPEKAIKASMALIEAIHRINIMLTQMFRTEIVISIRIGISTGPSTIRPSGSAEKKEYTIISNMIDLAEELSAFAKPGEIIVSEAAFRAARYLFYF